MHKIFRNLILHIFQTHCIQNSRGVISVLGYQMINMLHSICEQEDLLFCCNNGFSVHRYAYLSRRCISKDECQNMNHIRRFSKLEEIQTWRPFNNSCVTQCPDGFEDYVDDKNVRIACILLLHFTHTSLLLTLFLYSLILHCR